MQIQYLHCDNTAENVAFEKAWKQGGMGMEFKVNAPSTPQQNGHVKRTLTRYMPCSMAGNSLLF